MVSLSSINFRFVDRFKYYLDEDTAGIYNEGTITYLRKGDWYEMSVKCLDDEYVGKTLEVKILNNSY